MNYQPHLITEYPTTADIFALMLADFLGVFVTRRGHLLLSLSLNVYALSFVDVDLHVDILLRPLRNGRDPVSVSLDRDVNMSKELSL